MNRSGFRLLAGLMLVFGWALLLGTATVQAEPAAARWTIQQGDRVVLLGSTFIERENTYGQIELALRLTHPELTFSFRNLGWSGDNVLGESRAYFGPVQAGSNHLREYVNLLQPTKLLVSYGHNAAYEGLEQLEPFLKQYGALLNDLKAEDRQLIVLGLTPLEAIHRSPAEVAKLNAVRKEYNAAIQQLCEAEQLVFVNLFAEIPRLQRELRLEQITDNGLHYQTTGYAVVGEAVLESLGKSLLKQNELLPLDSQFQAVSRPLQEKIVWKNELFFHRFRPQNETYLRGFRKHEQGQNAKEIFEFDPLVEQEEKQLPALTSQILKSWSANQ